VDKLLIKNDANFSFHKIVPVQAAGTAQTITKTRIIYPDKKRVHCRKKWAFPLFQHRLLLLLLFNILLLEHHGQP
jgi:hypothetical protein